LAYGQKFMITYLLRDGLLEEVDGDGDLRMDIDDSSEPGIRVLQSYGLTDSGRDFVRRWITAAPLEIDNK
jgi:hypothetical protein